MTDHDALEAYDRPLASIGERAGAIGPRRLASHRPHVGRHYRGLVVAGQALQGWDPAVTGARWHANDARTAAGRAAIVERTRSWFADAADPVGVIATLGNRRRSPFSLRVTDGRQGSRRVQVRQQQEAVRRGGQGAPSRPGRASRDGWSGDDCARTAKGAVQPAKQPTDDGVGFCTDFLIRSRC